MESFLGGWLEAVLLSFLFVGTVVHLFPGLISNRNKRLGSLYRVVNKSPKVVGIVMMRDAEHPDMGTTTKVGISIEELDMISKNEFPRVPRHQIEIHSPSSEWLYMQKKR